MEVEGQIEEIIYKNDINSYTVASFMTDDHMLITIVGYLPFVSNGDYLKLVGGLVKHPSYGEQFKVETFEKTVPETEEGLIKYLAEGDFEGIGPAKAKKIVSKFGKDTINIIKNYPKELICIKGISLEMALNLSEKFTSEFSKWELVRYLDTYGISLQNADKINQVLGEDAINIIKKNPYILVEILNRINFEKIDSVALKMGFEYDNYSRIRSGIKYAMERITIDGHSCALYDNLVAFSREMLKVSPQVIEDAIINMRAKEEIVIEDREDTKQEYVYLNTYYNTEKGIARRILNLNSKKNKNIIPDMESEIKKVEKKLDIKLSDMQKSAIKCINDNNVCIITGGPGTGKTTIIKSIIEIFKKQNLKPVLCAPTGRAAKRMTEVSGIEAKTLHRLLEISGVTEDIDFRTGDFEVKAIEGDIVIVDEASMIDMFLMNYLLKGIFTDTRLVLVGDIDQLPSVGPGNVLKDLIESEKIETIRLNEIFRQAAKSKIIVNAHKINEGEHILEEDEKESKKKLLDDLIYVEENSEDVELQKVLGICMETYRDKKSIDNFQIISPTKRGMLGTKELNDILQKTLNPPKEDVIEKKIGNTIYRENDRVMQIKNNYQITWRKYDDPYNQDIGSGIFNGELGRITHINNRDKQITVKFDDGKEALYEFSDMDQLDLAYAITVHKSQGSEFDIVLLVISKAAPMLLTRNLLYTAVTRARKLLIIIGQKNIINYMVDNNNSKKRSTGLLYKLNNYKIGEKDGK